MTGTTAAERLLPAASMEGLTEDEAAVRVRASWLAPKHP